MSKDETKNAAASILQRLKNYSQSKEEGDRRLLGVKTGGVTEYDTLRENIFRYFQFSLLTNI